MPLSRDLRSVLPVCSIFLLLPPAAIGQSKRVAVYDFDSKAVRGDVIRIYGSDKNVGAMAAQRILSKLVGKGNFVVIDRNQIDNLMKEQNFKFSDRFDPRDAPKLGKLLNVDAIVTGSVDAISDEVQNNRVGVGPVGLGKVEAVAEVTISIRVISTQTAQIFLADQVNNKQKHTLGKGARVGRSGGGDGGSISLHPEAMAANLAIQGAADTLAAEILAKADALPTRVPTSSASSKPSAPETDHNSGSSAPVPSRLPDSTAMTVGKVDGNRVFLTGGDNLGVKVNDYYEVRRVSGTMKGPSGNDIEMDDRVEIVVVTEVQDQYSVARPASGATAAKVGDRVKKTKAPATPKAPASPAKKATAPAPAAGTAGFPAPVQRKQ